MDSLGIPYEGIGIGYGDGIIDNERFGMRRFVYYIRGNNESYGEPFNPADYYNYMNGIWKTGQKMAYGGNGLTPASGANPDIQADYMFPGDTDPFNWGTGGVDVDPWDEETRKIPPIVDSFRQRSFYFEQGYNNITMGVVGAGDCWQSL